MLEKKKLRFVDFKVDAVNSWRQITSASMST